METPTTGEQISLAPVPQVQGEKREAGWIAPLSSRLVSIASTALILGSMSVTFALSLAAIVYSGPLAPHLSDGIRSVAMGGLAAVGVGCAVLALVPAEVGVFGYIGAIGTITTGYALFQTGNNTAVMKGRTPDQRGVMSGLLSLARNIGLITGASVMGAVFTLGSSAKDAATDNGLNIANATALTFAVAVALAGLATMLALTSGRTRR